LGSIQDVCEKERLLGYLDGTSTTVADKTTLEGWQTKDA